MSNSDIKIGPLTATYPDVFIDGSSITTTSSSYPFEGLDSDQRNCVFVSVATPTEAARIRVVAKVWRAEKSVYVPELKAVIAKFDNDTHADAFTNGVRTSGTKAMRVT